MVLIGGVARAVDLQWSLKLSAKSWSLWNYATMVQLNAQQLNFVEGRQNEMNEKLEDYINLCYTI